MDAHLKNTTRLLLALILAAAGCSSGQTDQGTTPAVAADHGALPRLRFNQLALRLNIPLFWEVDRDEDRTVDPDEVRSLLFYPTREVWVEAGAFTPAFDRAFAQLVEAAAEPAPEDPRRRLVRQELDDTAPTLVHNDLRQLPEAHQAFARHVLRVGALIDELYARQLGMTALADRVAEDVESQSLFRRNWGAACLGSATEHEPDCSAIAGSPPQPVGVYPASIQAADDFCQALEGRPNSKQLLTPFAVVREREGALVAVPYTEAFSEQMRPAAEELRAAAQALEGDADEAPLRAYLTAAAQAFEDNNWEPADEAWAAMNARNSRWYLRVGPDETYWDPCSRKAGFHLTLALINRDSLAWQDRLTPVQTDMEAALASLTDAYEPREVSFHLPDFIDIVVNGGDDRNAFGATIGQSLPNWGPVSDEGRGRTVAMSNLYTDPDSVAQGRARAASMLTAETLALLTDSPEPGLLSTILHEACHNLGPSSGHLVDGQTDDEVFGGPLASMLEELKAQSGALYLIDFLRQRGVITEQQQRETYLESIVWALGHISRGMYTASGGRKAYSQLAAIQIGFLMDQGVITFAPEGPAANGTDQGAFTVDFAGLPAAIEALMRMVMEIKARGERARAEELATRYVDGDRVPQPMIVERSRRFPRATLVYSLDL